MPFSHLLISVLFTVAEKFGVNMLIDTASVYVNILIIQQDEQKDTVP